jgi:hypothetical protein
MEGTLLRSFIAASKVRRWLARSDAPLFIQECKQLFDKAFGSKFKDSTIFEDPASLRGIVSPTPADLLPLIGKSSVTLRAHVAHVNVTYSRSTSHLGNSLVLYYSAGDASKVPTAGSIKYIYLYGGKVWLAVQRQLNAPAHIRNPFSLYPHFPASIYSTRLSSELETIDLAWLVGHYARWAINDELCVVLALFRVSNFCYLDG